MNTPVTTSSVQIKVTLPAQLKQYAQAKAQQYGLTVSSYIRHLVLDDVKDMIIPTFSMSKLTEKKGLQAKEDHRQGQTKQINDIDAFVDSLSE